MGTTKSHVVEHGCKRRQLVGFEEKDRSGLVQFEACGVTADRHAWIGTATRYLIAAAGEAVETAVDRPAVLVHAGVTVPPVEDDTEHIGHLTLQSTSEHDWRPHASGGRA
jgi:hypothetical protein